MANSIADDVDIAIPTPEELKTRLEVDLGRKYGPKIKEDILKAMLVGRTEVFVADQQGALRLGAWERVLDYVAVPFEAKGWHICYAPEVKTLGNGTSEVKSYGYKVFWKPL